MLHVTATDLQMYKIFKIMQVAFFGTHCSFRLCYTKFYG